MLMGILAADCVKVAFTFNVSYSAFRFDLSPDFNSDTCSGKSSTLMTVWLTLTSEIYNEFHCVKYISKPSGISGSTTRTV